MASIPAQPNAASTSSTAVAETTISNLTTRFPGKVQIHLHPSSSLPSAITSPSDSDTHSPNINANLPVPLLWTVESLKLLRSYGLTGSFTGTLAQFPQQNIFLGLPIQLLPEEVIYLLRRDLAVIVDEASSYRPNKKEELKEVERVIEEDRKSEQLSAWHERQLLRAKHSKSPLTPSLPPLHPKKTSMDYHGTTQSLQPPPTSPEAEIASVGLFEYLVGDKGMWCMNGLRFGGAFAVYPGDPLRYHSHYTAQLVLEKENIALTSLVANGRLGTAVKKTHLLCCVENFDAKLGLGEVVGGSGSGEKGGRKVLSSLRAGLFDNAPSKEGEAVREGGRKFAAYNVFSLAWAGFGT
ncbi:related to RNA splicing endonuclease gamma subunit [Ustilago sp. UG-2017a]|nr:related to RNA splicing endonuclease gamma subunit [Ustilago sp. UG-2017a]